MENTFDISVILPLNTSKVRDFDEMFKKAIESLNSQQVKAKELVIVHSTEDTLVSYLNEFNFGDINVKKVKFEGEPNYSSQINLGISE